MCEKDKKADDGCKCPACGNSENLHFNYDYGKPDMPVIDILCNECGEYFKVRNKMEIKRLKVSDAMMHALVFKLFTVEAINRKRQMDNAERACKYAHQPWNPLSKDRPMIEVNNNAYLEITEEDVVKYFNEYDKVVHCNTRECLPYVSVVSDNASNELQLYINGTTQAEGSDFVVTCNDVYARSQFVVYEQENDIKKYSFCNF